MIFRKLFSFQNNRLIFDLFIDNKINSFYTSSVLNELTKKSFITDNIITNNFKKIYIVEDTPDYLQFTLQKLNPNISIKKVKQYKGYLINLSEYNNADDYIKKNINRRNKKNLNSKKGKLYKNHQISTSVFWGDISKSDYNIIFEDFYKLLKNRFKEKKTHNRYLSNWKELQTSTFQKILDKKASLHVIYDDKKPISITLNFHKSDIIFSHIQTYDVNYSKYNMGDISMLHHLEWLINNNISIFDLSMGKTYYKQKWSNHKYTLIYHVFYNKKSILSIICAHIITTELKLIQFLRDKNIIGELINIDKFLYNYKQIVAKH